MYQIENSGDLLKSKRGGVRSRFGWTKVAPVVLLLGLTSFLTDISAEMVAATLPLYLVFGLRLSPFQFGLVDGLYQGASILVRLLSGYVADRWRNPKLVATVGYGLSTVSRPALLLVGANWNALAGVVLIDRIGKGIRTAPRDAMIAGSTPGEYLATAFGVHRAMDTAGAMIGPLLAAGILWLTAQAYDAVFVVSFGFALVGFAVIATFVRTPASVTATMTHPQSLRESFELLAAPGFRVLVLSGSLLALTTISDAFVYLILQERVQLPQSFFPLFYVSMALIFMLFAIPVGRLADRVGRRSIFGAGYVMLITAYGLLWSSVSSMVLVALVLCLMGLYYAATDGVLAALASAHLPTHLRSSGLALLATGIALARLCASTLYGWMWGMWGSQTAIGVFTVGMILATVTAWWLLWGVETQKG
ncbi:MAG: MFS transporter [Chloroflexi bacterium]|nr:MAG: MFS transporter [Chloroflexota bacterium]